LTKEIDMAGKHSTTSAIESSTPEAKAAQAAGKAGPRTNTIEQHSLHRAELTPEARHTRIAVAAYRLAEGRGFTPGGELEDWLRAELEVDGNFSTDAAE
jgi:Protein of unknown function (DUF2934)